MLNKSIIIVSVILLFISIAFEINYFSYASPVPHSEIYKISLADFKGIKHIGDNLDGNNEFAYIVTEIKQVSNHYPYVIAYFHPSRSYVYNSKTVGDKNLLQHELYHFHITEYIARKIRREITKNKSTDISDLIKKYKEEENHMQMLYDKETYHSYYIGQQLAWQRKTDSLLNTLSKYQ